MKRTLENTAQIIIYTILLVAFIRLGTDIIGGLLGAVIGSLTAMAIINLLDKKNSHNTRKDSRNFADTINFPVSPFHSVLLIVISTILLVVLVAAPLGVIYNLGPVYVAKHAGVDYKFSYLASETMPGYLQIIGAVIYFVLIGILLSHILLILTIHLENKIAWRRPQEFKEYSRWQRTLKRISIIAVMLLFAFIYAEINTYLLIKENGIIYNAPLSFNQKFYEWSDVKGISRHHYSGGDIGYFLVLSDGSLLKIDLNGSKFVSEKTGLMIIDE